MTDQSLSRQTLEARLRQIGPERYHDKHPFHHGFIPVNARWTRCRPGF